MRKYAFVYKKILNLLIKKIKSYFLPAVYYIKYGDFTLKIKPRYDNIQERLFLGKSHEEHVRIFLEKNIKPGMIYFDIGAHVGIFVLVASKLVGEKGQCVAFEPCSALGGLLGHNISLNNIRNVKVVKKAVSDKNNNIIFYQNRDFAMSSIVYFPTYNKRKVPSISLDAFCSKENIFPDFIKVDAEGAEVLIFKGMKNIFMSQKKAIILYELHPAKIASLGEDVSSIIEMFKRYQYETYVLDGCGETAPLSISDFSLQQNVYMVALPYNAIVDKTG